MKPVETNQSTWRWKMLILNKPEPRELSEDTSGRVPRTTRLRCWVHTWDNCFLKFAPQKDQNSKIGNHLESKVL